MQAWSCLGFVNSLISKKKKSFDCVVKVFFIFFGNPTINKKTRKDVGGPKNRKGLGDVNAHDSDTSGFGRRGFGS